MVGRRLNDYFEGDLRSASSTCGDLDGEGISSCSSRGSCETQQVVVLDAFAVMPAGSDPNPPSRCPLQELIPSATTHAFAPADIYRFPIMNDLLPRSLLELARSEHRLR